MLPRIFLYKKAQTVEQIKLSGKRKQIIRGYWELDKGSGIQVWLVFVCVFCQFFCNINTGIISLLH